MLQGDIIMLRKTIYAVVAILASGGFTAFAPMSAIAGPPPARTVTPSAPPSVGQHSGNTHSDLTCIGQFGGRILGGHICPLK
jgi:hypothetical protein